MFQIWFISDVLFSLDSPQIIFMEFVELNLNIYDTFANCSWVTCEWDDKYLVANLKKIVLCFHPILLFLWIIF